MNKRIILVPVAVLLALGVADRVSAHHPGYTADCEGITGFGESFTDGGSVDLSIGTAHAHHTFRASRFTYTLANPDRTQPEAWRIVIVSNAPEGSATYEGTVPACQTTTTVTGSSTPAVTSTTTPPTSPTTSTVSTPSTTAPSTTTSTIASIVAPSSSSPPTTDVPVSSTSSSVPAGSLSTTPTTPPPPVATRIAPISNGPSSSSPGPSLPKTGADTGGMFWGAALVLAAGFAMYCGSRRTRFGIKRRSQQ